MRRLLVCFVKPQINKPPILIIIKFNQMSSMKRSWTFPKILNVGSGYPYPEPKRGQRWGFILKRFTLKGTPDQRVVA
jgi:hypothetical protein